MAAADTVPIGYNQWVSVLCCAYGPVGPEEGLRPWEGFLEEATSDLSLKL